MMLEVQKYLAEKSHDELAAELAISVTRHDALPLVILNYNQWESPKLHPIVRECRALTLHSRTHEVVARAFPRFFNWGEVEAEMAVFDFSSVSVQSKEDGSLCLLYRFDGQWRVNTCGSFAQGCVEGSSATWAELFCQAAGVHDLQQLDAALPQDVTYVFELCSPQTKVVRSYPAPTLYLLTVTHNTTGVELSAAECDELAARLRVRRPMTYDFRGVEEIRDFLREQAAQDPTFEGVVIRDRRNNRWKLKSEAYLGLHRLRGEGSGFSPKSLLPFVLRDDADELLTYFPEARAAFFELQARVWRAYVELLERWADHKDIAEQKEFALAVKHLPFASLLFQVRKAYGVRQTAADLRRLWTTAPDAITKHLRL